MKEIKDKRRWDLVPWDAIGGSEVQECLSQGRYDALESLVRAELNGVTCDEAWGILVVVLEFGAEKYSDDNWKTEEPRKYIAAFCRHYLGADRYDLDPESGYMHLAHAYACAVFLAWFQKEGKL